MIRLFAHFLSVACMLFLVGAVAIYLVILDLPPLDPLSDYQPSLTTNVYSADGKLVAEFATQQRILTPIGSIPSIVRNAFLAAEDKNFYSHPGVDVQGIARAFYAVATGETLQGGSTITQQVVKNLLLTNERTFMRKLREALLAFQVEKTFSKDRILEMYLNEIYLGAGSYGVGTASLNYFHKPVEMLNAAEAAYLAALPKAPENYQPYRNYDGATARRNWVIERMQANGLLSTSQAEAAASTPLETFNRSDDEYAAGGYFIEEVRRGVAASFGGKALYQGGLSIETTLDPAMQDAARRSLQKALISYDQRRGWRGPTARISKSADWHKEVRRFAQLSDVPEWRSAAVLSVARSRAEIGLAAGCAAGRCTTETATVDLIGAKWALKRGQDLSDILSKGDVIYVEQNTRKSYDLRQVPLVQGAVVAMIPSTGEVKAMVGGFSFTESKFNRATQAQRQPGSVFKPIVYAAALDMGYSPSSVIADAPVEIPAGRGRFWRPKNHNGRFAGISTLRSALEQSRNVVTVRLARDIGMDTVADYSKRLGVNDHLAQYLPLALGAGETTLMKMVRAYSVFANGGKCFTPHIVNAVMDRRNRPLGTDTTQDRGAYIPLLDDFGCEDGDQILDPMTAYQVTSMLEGVVTRGTGRSVGTIGRAIAGKSGTTNGAKDTWFIGYTPDLVTGVFIGFDNPKSLGKSAWGSTTAAPVFIDFMSSALKQFPPQHFEAPPGMDYAYVDSVTGQTAVEFGRQTIMEHYKPGTGPSDQYFVQGRSSVDMRRRFAGDSHFSDNQGLY